MDAPASLYASSGIDAALPAFFSTTTSAPRPMNFFTDSGDAATRVSFGEFSFSTAIFMSGYQIDAMLPIAGGKARYRMPVATGIAKAGFVNSRGFACNCAGKTHLSLRLATSEAARPPR